MRFGTKGKLSPRYLGPYRIAKKIGNATNDLDLLQDWAVVHPMFHTSIVKKFMGDPSLIIPTKIIGLRYSFSYK